MNELIDTNPDIDVHQSEYKRLLGFPNQYELEGNALTLAGWAREWYAENANPWIYAIQINDLDLSGDCLRIHNTEFLSTKLCNQFAYVRVHSTMLLAVSAGIECEKMANQLWQQEKPDEYFFLEVYGSAVVEHLITTTSFRICEWADKNDLAVLPHYSPGYPGWKVEDQHKLLTLLNHKKISELPGEIDILESGLLKPKKTMLALFGIAKLVDKVKDLRELIPCKVCSLRSCQYRRTPYE